MTARLDLVREQILAFREQAVLDELGEQRLPPGPGVAVGAQPWAGLQDSMPRAAILLIHARVEGAGPDAWEDPSLVQPLGAQVQRLRRPRRRTTRSFRSGGSPTTPEAERVARRISASRLDAFLDGRTMRYGDACGDGLGEANANRLRNAATTGRVLTPLGRAPVSRPSGPWLGAGRRPAGRRYASSSRVDTCTSSARERPPPSPSGPGIGPARGRAASEALAGIADRGADTGRRWADPEPWCTSPRSAANGGHAAPARLLPSGDAILPLARSR